MIDDAGLSMRKLTLLILAYYNHLTTGNALLFGYQKAQLHAVEFGFVSSGPEQYSPVQALHNTVSDLLALSRDMFGWFISSWVLIFGWFVFTRFSGMELIVLALIVLQFVFYRLYHWFEQILGSRYLAELMPFFSILGGLGLARLIHTAAPKWRATLVTAIFIFCISAAIGSVGYWRGRLSSYRYKHQDAAAYMEKFLPSTQPLVVLIPYQYNDIGSDYAFRDVLIWLVYDQNEKAAQQTPEFKNCRWIRLFKN